ncbi:hypothetical protein EAG_01606 [Camponotus floridanus]|uniref:Importin subunit alpha-2 n=1 Tax=Camponotus floridanus TaxID=104421 RepID=E2AVZ4_CAMFO|nr:hypothetical protein EAG_01606 [Camponotus floridanus]
MLTTNEEIDEAGKLQSNDSNTVENLRVELREATLTKRRQNRTSAWDKNRKNLGECPENELFTVEYVNERVKFLKKKRISLKDYRYLPNALIQSEENIYAFLKVDQSLSGLIRDLSGNNPIFQLYAANCCCNIALGNTKACTVLGKAVIPYLLIELESLNYILLITASIRILANTLSNSCKDEADILLRNSKYSDEDLCLLLNKLLSHQYMHIRRETLWLIGNLYNHRSSSVAKNIRNLVAFLPALNQAFLSIGTNFLDNSVEEYWFLFLSSIHGTLTMLKYICPIRFAVG